MTPPLFRTPPGSVGARNVSLDGPEGHHAADVRRLRVGESLWLTDGAGARGDATVVAVRRGALDVEVADWTTVERSLPSLVVVQALAKGGRDEDAVEAMTEVGVDEVIGWQASRSIAKWTERTAAKWTGTAESAARQSRRVWWPSVTGPASTADVVERISAADVALVLHERAETAIASIDLTDAREVLAIVGPEGGISDEELDALRAVGAQVVRLGDSVLRSSTAGVAALSVVAAHTRWR